MANLGTPDFSTPSFDSSLIPAVDQAFGLQGLKLNTPIAAIEGLLFLEQREDVRVFTRPADSLHVGPAVVDSIEYCFKEDKLVAIFLAFSDETTGINVRNVFSRVYGRGSGTDRQVVWRGRRSDVIYVLKENKRGYVAFLLATTDNQGIIRVKELVNSPPRSGSAAGYCRKC